MPRASSAPRFPRSQLAGNVFPAEDWRRITALPAEIMIITIASLDGGAARRTVAEGLAGLDGIAAGRCSDSDLVREVVAAIFAEPQDERPPRLAAPVPDLPQVLADCRRVDAALRAYADPADAAAYRHWIQQIAVRVFAASRSGGLLGLVGEGAGETERTYLAELCAALT